MKCLTVVCLLAILTLAAGQARYSDRFDNIDVQEILNNHRLLKAYIACMLNKGKCTPEGRELKSHIEEALENGCAKCTDVQQTWTRQVIGHLINHEPAYWTELVAYYDPQRKYTAKYENELKSIKA